MASRNKYRASQNAKVAPAVDAKLTSNAARQNRKYQPLISVNAVAAGSDSAVTAT